MTRLFIERHARPKNRSWKETARLLGLAPDPHKPDQLLAINGGVAARWAERQIDAITRRDIISLLDETVIRAPIVANRTLAALRKLGNWCVSRDLVPVSFCAGVQAPTSEITRDRVLSNQEIIRLWAAAEAEGYPFGHLTKLLLLTGQRRQEVAAMREDELDLEAAVWSLSSTRTKNGRPHQVPLSEPAIELVRQLPRFAAGPYLFSATGSTPFSGFSRAFARLHARMGEIAGEPIPRWTLHDLRRTAATNMAALGTAPHVIEAVLNHVSGSRAGVAGIYNRHHHAEDKRLALDAWARQLQVISAKEIAP